jgi:uncharacterized repeat protein (TIGR03803 family)
MAFLLLATLLIPTAARAQLPLEVVHTFTGNQDPSRPRGALIQAADGDFYGTTESGGAFYGGTIFRMTSAGRITLLHSFEAQGDGADPLSGVIQATDGNFYGTTAYGGSTTCPFRSLGCGTVFRMTPGGIVTVLHAFDGTTDGSTPYVGLVQASDRNFYGVTAYYGAHDGGTVFRITPSGAFTVLHAFSGPSPRVESKLPGDTDGASPQARLIQSADGYLYGTTWYGGAYGYGTVFRMSLDGSLAILHAFGAQGAFLPRGALLEASDGNFYGTSSEAVFRMSRQGAVTILGTFGFGDFFYDTPLIQATDGNLYGVMDEGSGQGSIFRMTLGGGFTILHSFTLFDGSAPRGALLQARDGRFYGTTFRGGTAAFNGTAYSITLDGTFALLASFTAGPEGASPWGTLARGSDGSFYGITSSGGVFGQGTAFRISTTGATATLHDFTRDEGYPEGDPIQGRDGNLYLVNGSASRGRVYRLTPSGTMSLVYAFTGAGDGSSPHPLIQATDGNLYGTTRYSQGSIDNGTVFRLTPSGLLTTLHTFGGADSGSPGAALVQGSDGNFYGTTWNGGPANKGRVFRVTPGGVVTVLHTFNGLRLIYGSYDEVRGSEGDPGDGAEPLGKLIEAADGAFYGTTRQGGDRGLGTLFRITPQGQFSLLHSFGAPGDGTYPRAPLVQTLDGSLYGTTWDTIFRRTPGGTFTVLHKFSWPDGGASGGLTQGSDGYLYGTNSNSFGQVFRFNPRFALVPTVLFGHPQSRGGLTLTWAAVPGDVRYTVVRTGGPAGQAVLASGLSGNTFIDSSTAPGLVYSYVVVAVGNGESFASDPFVVPYLSPASRTPTVTTVGDYDGDGRADLTVYRQSTGEWLTRQSSDAALLRSAWGAPLLQDRPVPADYDGDGVTDMAVYRQTTAQWLVRRSSDGAGMPMAWGAPTLGDLPVPADYDGDGHADIAVYRSTTGDWLIRQSTNGALVQLAWGSAPHGDLPVPADYDGDGHADLAVYRTTTGEWFIHRSYDGALMLMSWGSPAHGDVPVPADYDGDGRTDLAVFRAASGEWLIRRSTDGALIQLGWGAPLLGDVPVVGDYDADGRADLAVYRESTAEWFIRGADGHVAFGQWGAPSIGDTVRPF